MHVQQFLSHMDDSSLLLNRCKNHLLLNSHCYCNFQVVLLYEVKMHEKMYEVHHSAGIYRIEHTVQKGAGFWCV